MGVPGLGRTPGWYWRRLRRFERGELTWRVGDALGRRRWMRRVGSTPIDVSGTLGTSCRFATIDDHPALDPTATAALVATADRLLAGHWPVFGTERHDLVAPDWSSDGRDPSSRPTDLDGTAADVSVKDVWELSRHHVLTVLGAATWATGDARYAERAASLLSSWLDANADPATSPHWSSVEMAERLISWTWLRRLAGHVPAVEAVMSSTALRRMVVLQVEWLHRFPSRYSSANNHRIAEAAGVVVASCGFRDLVPVNHVGAPALAIVEDELARQVSPSGLQREPAPDYHCFVLDLAIVALADAARAGLRVDGATVERLGRMADALALAVDTGPGDTGSGDLRAPRIGDSDESEVAQMDPPGIAVATRTLSLAAAVCDIGASWPSVPATVRGALVAAFAGDALRSTRSPADPEQLARDGYLAVLRSPDDAPAPRWWAAMRVGEFSYLPIGSHSHADLLSLELRVDGHDVVVDPGTYVYGALPGWRKWLRGTLAHPTVCLDDTDQVEYWGPFLWGGDARARTTTCTRDDRGRVIGWRAEHDAYTRLASPATVSREVRLAPDGASITVVDRITRTGPGTVTLTWPLAPGARVGHLHGGRTQVQLDGGAVIDVELAAPLRWQSIAPGTTPQGCTSPSFGRLVGAPTLRGSAAIDGNVELVTVFSARGLSVRA